MKRARSALDAANIRAMQSIYAAAMLEKSTHGDPTWSPVPVAQQPTV
jgi:hypothetical protein